MDGTEIARDAAKHIHEQTPQRKLTPDEERHQMLHVWRNVAESLQEIEERLGRIESRLETIGNRKENSDE